MAAPQIRYPAAVFGYGARADEDYGELVEYMVADEAITKGKCVQISTTTFGRVVTALTDSTHGSFVGIAAEAAATTGDIIPVTIQGISDAVIATTITAGNYLGASATVAGNLAVVTAGVAVTLASHLGMVRAIALESAASATGAVRVRIVKI